LLYYIKNIFSWQNPFKFLVEFSPINSIPLLYAYNKVFIVKCVYLIVLACYYCPSFANAKADIVR